MSQDNERVVPFGLTGVVSVGRDYQKLFQLSVHAGKDFIVR